MPNGISLVGRRRRMMVHEDGKKRTCIAWLVPTTCSPTKRACSPHRTCTYLAQERPHALDLDRQYERDGAHVRSQERGQPGAVELRVKFPARLAVVHPSTKAPIPIRHTKAIAFQPPTHGFSYSNCLRASTRPSLALRSTTPSSRPTRPVSG